VSTHKSKIIKCSQICHNYTLINISFMQLWALCYRVINNESLIKEAFFMQRKRPHEAVYFTSTQTLLFLPQSCHRLPHF